jgi:hypothetical protein
MVTREKYPHTYNNVLTREKNLRHWQVVNKMMIPAARTSQRIKKTNLNVFSPSLPAFKKSFAFPVCDTTGSEIPCKALITILSGTDTVPIVSVNALYHNLDMTYFVQQEPIKKRGGDFFTATKRDKNFYVVKRKPCISEVVCHRNDRSLDEAVLSLR